MPLASSANSLTAGPYPSRSRQGNVSGNTRRTSRPSSLPPIAPLRQPPSTQARTTARVPRRRTPPPSERVGPENRSQVDDVHRRRTPPPSDRVGLEGRSGGLDGRSSGYAQSSPSRVSGRPPLARTPPTSPPTSPPTLAPTRRTESEARFSPAASRSVGSSGQQRRRARRTRGSDEDSDSDDFFGAVPRAPPEEPDDAWEYFQDLENQARQRAASEGPGRVPPLEVLKWTPALGFADECSICLMDFQDEDEVSRLRCGHGFHTQCVARWVNTRSRCPMCRASAASPQDF